MSESGAGKATYFLNSVIILIAICAYLGKYAFNVLLAQTLPSGAYGDLAIAIRIFMLFAALLPLGTGTAAKRFLSRHIGLGEFGEAAGYIRWALSTFLIASIIYWILLGVVVFILYSLGVYGAQSFVAYHVIFYLAILSPLGALIVILTSYLQCNQNLIAYNILSSVLKYLLLITIVALVFYYFNFVFSYKLISFIYFATLFLSIIIIFGIAFFLLPRKIFSFLVNKTKSVRLEKQDWARASRNLILNQVVFLAVTMLDLLIVKLLIKDGAQVDIYAAVLVISGFLWTVSQAAYTPLSPIISRYILKTDLREPEIFQRKLAQVNYVNFFVLLILVIGLLVFYKPLILTFGKTYATHSAKIVFYTLVIGIFIASFSASPARIMAYSGNELWLVYGSIGELLFLIIMLFVLIPPFGIVGAAIASVSTMVVKLCFFAGLVRFKLGIRSLTVF